jgi:hypothetical protein
MIWTGSVDEYATVLAHTVEFPTVDYLLARVDERDIFHSYLGIYPSVEGKVVYCSPLRVDRHPTCWFVRGANNRLYFQDFGANYDNKSRLDCFDVAQYVTKKPFWETLLDIASRHKPWEAQNPINLRQGTLPKPTIYEVKYQPAPWSQRDIWYWGLFGISVSTLAYFNVEPAKMVWVKHPAAKEFQARFYYDENVLLYVYNFKQGQYKKVYMPLAKKKEHKWWSNAHHKIIQGFEQLTYYTSVLVITKSLKDVMWWYQNLGVDSIALQSESTLVDQELLGSICDRYKTVVVNYDNDPVGKANAAKLKAMLPNARLVFVPNDYKYSKDFTDLTKNTSLDYAKSVAKQQLQW